MNETLNETLNGFVRRSTDEQDLMAQREALVALGVAPDRIYIDHGMSGTRRERPTREGMAVARSCLSSSSV